MSYYQFNRQEILQKAKERYSKEKAAEYYLQKKEVVKEKARNRYRNFSEKENNIKRVSKKEVSRVDSIQKRSIKNKLVFLSVV